MYFQTRYCCVRFGVFTADNMSILVFRVARPCGLVDTYQRLEEHTVSLFRAEVHFSPHDVTTQTTNVDIVTDIALSVHQLRSHVLNAAWWMTSFRATGRYTEASRLRH